jgi:hypothetical protein
VALTPEVRFGSLADIRPCPLHVRLPPESGHCSAPLACMRRVTTGVMHRSKNSVTLYYLVDAHEQRRRYIEYRALGHFVRRTIMAFCRTQELKGP